ncbi:8383_t:CDS:2 [Funneliformis geosporum]|uniref:site-specific DNA-methyltransferase (adenine-specific) n=1 Tax=Funneliformis geosporum TaxID=1117311 RepID=A0A9W4X4M5_9GLOM|nr:8383_t:CDS:2 [Funneliformis geosporum]
MMLQYINNTVLPSLAGKYNHSGEVFQKQLLIEKPETLKNIIEKLSPLRLLDADSDIKGDAFEYFLKNSVSVGNDLGEYFTPRHIVKLIVEIVDPKFGETVYDPACGTGGFLIEAFKHIKNKCKQNLKNLKFLKEETIFGREISGTTKIAKMNMIIIGDGHNNIRQMDSLEFPVRDKYDIVLTNFPFSQTTDYSSLYGFVSKDANPIFLKHVIDSLKKQGTAGVIVPEGLLFDENLEYVKIRKILLQNCEVIAIIKLHESTKIPTSEQAKRIAAESNLFTQRQINQSLRETNTILTQQIQAYEQNYSHLQNTYQIALKDKQTTEKQLNQLTGEIKNVVRLLTQWQKFNYYQQLEKERSEMKAQIIQPNFKPPP